MSVYKFSNDKLCKVCQLNGEWTKFSDVTLCQTITTQKPSINCKYNDLKALESTQPDYIRLRIESSNGIAKIDERSITDDKLASKTVVVYLKYLNSQSTRSSRDLTANNFNSSYPFTKKYCRYCDDGVWSEMESCVSLNCDKDQLMSNPDLVLIPSLQKPMEIQNLFQPSTVMAVYTFGSDKFCKQCHDNGEWSKYSLGELCKASKLNEKQPSRKMLTTKPVNQRESSLYELYKNEKSCNMNDLNEIKTHFANLKWVYLVSADRKSKLNPTGDAQIPSRALSLYESRIETSTKRFCSICIDGYWSNITSFCTADSLYYCEKEGLSVSGVIKTYDRGADKLAPDYQNLFEPGTVMVEYELSETTKICKICVSKGEYAEWSKYAEAKFCDFDTAFEKYKNKMSLGEPCLLKELRSENETLTREAILSYDARTVLSGESIEDQAMIVYYSYNATDKVKYCRKCASGKWDKTEKVCPQEFTVAKCDPLKIRGYNYFVNANDGSQLTDGEQTKLVFPSKVVAVYVFGSEKYCKACNEDGTWTSYPQYQICEQVKWKN